MLGPDGSVRHSMDQTFIPKVHGAVNTTPPTCMRFTVGRFNSVPMGPKGIYLSSGSHSGNAASRRLLRRYNCGFLSN